MNLRILPIFILFAAFFACSEAPKKVAQTTPEPQTFDTLQSWMTGSFSSSLQAQNDSDYYDICLEMHPVWQDDSLNTWMYVEQSLASMTDRPYRQRVYRLVEEGDSSFRSEIYTFNDPSEFTGQWKNEDLWSSYTPDSILLKEGCAVYLDLSDEGHYHGSTDSATCLSTLRGAAYANSIVTVNRKGITSWDQGFDSTGVQVWGAEKGGYMFLRSN